MGSCTAGSGTPGFRGLNSNKNYKVQDLEIKGSGLKVRGQGGGFRAKGVLRW